MWQDQPNKPYYTKQIGLESCLPRLVTKVLKNAGRRPAGVIDENIDTTKLAHRRLDNGLELLLSGDICRNRQNTAAAFFANLPGGVLQRLRVARSYSHIGAFCCQGSCARSPKSFTGRQNECGLPFKS